MDRDITKWIRTTKQVYLNPKKTFHLERPVAFRERYFPEIVVSLRDSIGTSVITRTTVDLANPRKISVAVECGVPTSGELTITYLPSDATA